MRKPTREELRSASLPRWILVEEGATINFEITGDLLFLEEGEMDLFERIVPWDQYQLPVMKEGEKKPRVLCGPAQMFEEITKAIEKAGYDFDSPDFYKGQQMSLYHLAKYVWQAHVKKTEDNLGNE